MMLKIMKLFPDRLYISLQYFKYFKRFPNLKNSKTFNEKLQWLKPNDHRDINPEHDLEVGNMLTLTSKSVKANE